MIYIYIRHLCTRLKTDGILKIGLKQFPVVSQGATANTRNRDRVCLFWTAENRRWQTMDESHHCFFFEIQYRL